MSSRWVEKVGVAMTAFAHERRDQLRARGTERHAVPGEATAHKETRAYLSDIRKRVVREAHRAGPPVRDLGVDAVLAEERVQVRLHLCRRRLVLADLALDRGVAPSTDDDTAVPGLTPVAIAAMRVRGPLEHPACRRRREHLPARRANARRLKVRRVRVGAEHDRPRVHRRTLRADLASRYGDDARALVDLRATLD